MVHTIDNQNESVMVDDGVNSLSRLRGFHKLQIYEMLCLGASLKKTKEWDILEDGAFALSPTVNPLHYFSLMTLALGDILLLR